MAPFGQQRRSRIYLVGLVVIGVLGAGVGGYFWFRDKDPVIIREPGVVVPEKPTRVEGKLDLQVVDAGDGKPIAEAEVAVSWNGNWSPAVRTDPEGRATVSHKNEGWVQISAKKEGYVHQAVSWSGRGGSAVDVPASYVMRLARGTRVSGRVVGGPTSRPVEGATITFEYENQRNVEPPVIMAMFKKAVKTDADGRWSFDEAPADVDKLRLRVVHPDFVSNPYKQRRPSTPSLLDGSAVTVLEPGVEVAGTIVGPDGKPVKKAKVTTVQTYYVVNDYGLTAETDTEGHYRLAHLPAEPTTITVTAKGLAPDLRQVNATENMESVDFTLQTGQTLRGRVVDPSGNPISGAFVSTRRWRNMESLGWQGRTDAQGRFAMPDGPGDAVMFSVSVQGYRYVTDQVVKASDGETAVKMMPDVKVTGSVTDAETGRPVDRFRVIVGYALWAGRPPMWSFTDARAGKEGRYEADLQPHSQVVGSYVRIEADGYVPAVSPPMTASGAFDARMRRGADVAGTVRNPDGSPAGKTEVQLVPDGAQVSVINGTVPEYAHQWPVTRTDEQGRFRFSPQEGTFHLVVLGEKAYVIVRRTPDMPASADVTLTPWARIEGTYNPRGLKPFKAASSFNVGIVDATRELRDPSPRFFWQNMTTPDADGHYAVTRVPHYDGAPATVSIGLRDRNVSEMRSMPARLSPGQTLRLDVLPVGATVKGRVEPATAADAIAGAQIHVSLMPVFPLPASQWPAGPREAAEQSKPVYNTQCEADGSFSLPAVAPGTYAYLATAYSGSGPSICVSGTVDAAGRAEGAVLDLGTLRYSRQDMARVGEPMPTAEVGRRLEDGQPIRLNDYAGKVVVLAAWDSRSGMSDAAMPHFGELGKRYAGDARVALVGINMDPTWYGGGAVLPIRPAVLESPTWVRGYASAAEQAMVARLGATKWPALLIVGADGRLLARDVAPEALVDAVAKAIAK